MFDEILENIDLSQLDYQALVRHGVFALLGLLVLAVIVVVCRDTHRFVTREYYFCAAELAKNAKVVLLSDLHGKQYGKNNHELWNAIELIAPDYIFIAGDMLTARKKANNEPLYEFLNTLSTKYPVFFANGNHEMRLMQNAESYGAVAERFSEAMNEIPLVYLENSSTALPDMNMRIYGLNLEKSFYRRYDIGAMNPEYLKEVLGEADKTAINILIAHNPEYFRSYMAWGADLVVAGHLHGGIIKLPLAGGVISPRFKLFPKYDGGSFMKGKQMMVVSRGLGAHTLPFRLFNPGELVVIHLRH